MNIAFWGIHQVTTCITQYQHLFEGTSWDILLVLFDSHNHRYFMSLYILYICLAKLETINKLVHKSASCSYDQIELRFVLDLVYHRENRCGSFMSYNVQLWDTSDCTDPHLLVENWQLKTPVHVICVPWYLTVTLWLFDTVNYTYQWEKCRADKFFLTLSTSLPTMYGDHQMMLHPKSYHGWCKNILHCTLWTETWVYMYTGYHEKANVWQPYKYTRCFPSIRDLFHFNMLISKILMCIHN